MVEASGVRRARKPDRRTAKTRRALRNALVALILEKGYEAITVQDITDRADLNRGTLYLHYRDKQDLLLSSSMEVYDQLVAQLAPVSAEHLTMDVPERNLVLIFEHVAANADFYRVMFGDHGVPAFVRRLRHVLEQAGLARLEALKALGVLLTPLPAALTVSFIGGATIGVIEWWLENDRPISPEALAAYTLQLSVSGLYPSGQGLPAD